MQIEDVVKVGKDAQFEYVGQLIGVGNNIQELELLYQRPWFHGLWVVQEAVLAKTFRLLIEEREIDLNMFLEIAYQRSL